MREVAAWRATLAEWQQRVERCELTLAPIRGQLHAALRQWLQALEAAALHPGLNRAERAELDALISETSAELRSEDDNEPPEEADAPEVQGQQADDEEPWRQAAEAAATERARRTASRRAESKRKRLAAQTTAVSQ